MPERWSLEQFANLTRTPVEEIERFVSVQLLDPDRDGLFDDADVYRLQLLLTEGGGKSVEELAELARSTDDGRRLFGLNDRRYSPEEAAAEFGISADQISALGTVLGLGPDDPVGDDVREMLDMVRRMMADGMPWEAVLEGARVYADSIGRLAEAGVQLTHRFLCEPLERAGHDEREIAMAFSPSASAIGGSAQLLAMALYRHFTTRAVMAHARAHLEPREPDAPPGSVRTTILFVDLALFSSLADTAGDEEAMRVIDRFDQCIREYSLRHNGRLVKQIGDEFMLVFRDAAESVRFAIGVHETMARLERFVALRTGIHSGSVLYRIGDYYGTAVNIAARIASMAMPNAVLVTEPVAKAAVNDGIEVEEIGVRSLRGMEEPLALYRVVS
jgi:class 3 adenylate cyclase